MNSGAISKPARQSLTTEAYEVGYKRPPAHSRFKKGQSGNPKGRPKGAKSPKVLLEEALSASVTVMENGVPKKTELRRLLFKSLVSKAVKGDSRSTRLLVKLMEQYGLSQADGEDGKIVVVIDSDLAKIL